MFIMHLFKDLSAFKLLLVCSLCFTVMASSRTGGLSEEKPADAEVQKVIDNVKNSVELDFGTPLDVYTALAYKTQVVAGINYFVKTQVGENEFAVLRVYKHFSEPPVLHGVLKTTSSNDEIKYF